MKWRRVEAFVALQVLEDEGSGSASAQEGGSQNQLLLERAEDALAGGVVVPAVSFAAHAADHSLRVEDSPVFGTAVLAAVVAVVNQAGWRTTNP